MINNGNNTGGGAPMPTISIDPQIQSGQQKHTSPTNNNHDATTGAAATPAGVSPKENPQRRGPSAAAAATTETQPAFPGAKHDVNGYCTRHSKIRLCQPVYNADDGTKKQNAVEPIKYRTLRKFCPSCGVSVPTKYSSKSAPHFPSRKNGHKYQNQNGLVGVINSSKDKAKQSTISKRDIGNDKGNKEKVNKSSNKTHLENTKEKDKTAPQQTQRGNNDKKEVTKSKDNDKGNGRENKEKANQTKDNKNNLEKLEERKAVQQQPTGINIEKKDGSKSKDNVGEGKARQLLQEKGRGTQQQLQESNTEKKNAASKPKEKSQDNAVGGKERQPTQEKNSGTQPQLQESNTEKKNAASKLKEKSQDNAGGGKERKLMQNETTKKDSSGTEKGVKRDNDKYDVKKKERKDSLGGEGKKGTAAADQGNKGDNAAEVPKSRPCTELEKGKSSSSRDIKATNKKESTSDNHHDNAVNNHSRWKGHADDTKIPLTKSPNVPKYTLKFTKGCFPKSMPFERQEVKAKDDVNNQNKTDDSSQRATGVFMMAAGLKVAKDDENKKEQNLKAAAAQVVEKQPSSKQDQVVIGNNKGMPKKGPSNRSKEKDKHDDGDGVVSKSKPRSHSDSKKELSHKTAAEKHTTSKEDQVDDNEDQPKKPQSNNEIEKERPTGIEVVRKSKPNRHDNAKEHSNKMAATAEKTISSKYDQFDNAQTSLSNKEGQTKKVPSKSNRKDRPTSNGDEVIRKTKLINDGNVKAPIKNASEGKDQKADSSGNKNKSEVNKSTPSGNEEGKSNNNPPHHAKIDVSINHTTKSEKRSTGTQEQAIKRASSTGSAINEKRSGTREQCISRRASTGITTTGKHQLNRVTSTGSGDNKNKPETMNKAKKPATGHSDIAKKQKKDDDINQTTTLSKNNGSKDRHMKRDHSSGKSGDENKPGKALSNKGNTHGENKNEHHTKTEDHAKNELHAPKRDSKGGIVGVSMDHSRLSAGSSNQRPSRGRSHHHHVEKGVRFKQQRGRSLVVTTSRTSGGYGNGTSEKVVVDQSGVAKSSNNNDDDNVKKRYRRSKSMPQQRAQRIRVPSEYHVTKCLSTFSTYRQVYLDELAQMSVQVPTDIKVKR